MLLRLWGDPELLLGESMSTARSGVNLRTIVLAACADDQEPKCSRSSSDNAQIVVTTIESTAASLSYVFLSH